MKNRVEIEGVLQEAPELKSGSPDGGTLIATGRLIHQRERKDGAPVTNYFNIVGRNEAAVKMAALPAGARVEIEGRLSVRSWTDERGYKRTIFEIYVLEIKRD